MSSLELILRRPLEGRTDLSGIVPDRLLPLSTAEIGNLQVIEQGKPQRLSELFQIVDGDRDKLILKGDLARADHVGGDMRDGMLVVEGPVGHCLARDMRRGAIHVHGSAGNYACSGQRGGVVHVEGDVDDFCAAALPGERRGMRGGTLRVGGSAGRFLGQRMRRGTLVVAGDVDQGAASGLVAGTIICCQRLASPVAVGMRRGTLVCLRSAPQLHAGFTVPEPIRLSYLYLLFDALRPQLPDADAAQLARGLWWRSLGDRASAGTGEILWIDASAPDDGPG
ncbi:MAG: formylmethanofuran dehydrogenase subunit C [Aureliella sp.]